MAVKPKTTKPRKKRKSPQASTTGKRNPKVVQDTWRTRLMTSRVKFDDDQKEIYLLALADHGRKGDAAKTAGVCPQTVLDHCRNDPNFEAAFNNALDAYRDKFVDHATNLALNGVEKRRYNKDGDLVEETKEYPIRLIELELKRVEPGYRDKQTIDMNHKGGVLLAPAGVSPADWMKQQAEENSEKESKDG